eukprot:TRINITY_DN70024_c0_g1_i1.p1 TRINITY_DN70024_c0_g1~~TRINITY_DN70024_c0_g1_i1.p1  ORF type:complete len:497 (+),score=120.71 TRINITY_DN70024_c0_g1_i1:94-1491(+)
MGPAPTTVKAVWMNPALRAWLMAMRPWSIPASIVPWAVAGAVLHVQHGAELLSTGFLCAFAVVVFLHIAANLFNTYFDFVGGCDTKESADDRALVDNTVTPRSVLLTGAAFAAAGCAAGLCIAAERGFAGIAQILGPALILTVGYSAGKASLKRYGLGDLTVFAMFGPLLASGVSIAVTGELSGLVIAYSAPIGLQTVAILHANNARDVSADRSAGVITVAQKLGPRGSYFYHCFLLGTSYAAVAVLALCGHFGVLGSDGGSSDSPRSWRQVWVFLAAPWALYVTRRFAAQSFHELPQTVAQHNLLFGTLLCGALSRPLFAARVMLGCLFYLGGVNSVLMWRYMAALVHQKLTNVVPATPEWLSQVLLCAATVGQAACSALFMLGYETVLMARLLVLFLAPVTVFVHDLWTIETDHPAHDPPPTDKAVARRTVANFPTEFDSEFCHFFKNCGMIGGLLLYIEMAG